MNILNTFVRLAMGKLDAANDKLSDDNAIALLESSIREAEKSLSKAQGEVARLEGSQKYAQNQWNGLNDEYTRIAASRQNAEIQGRSDLIPRIDERLNQLESQGATLRAEIESYETALTGNRRIIATSQDQLRTLKQEVSTLKVNDSVQRSQEMLTAGMANVGGTVNSAADAVEKLKRRQAERGAMLQAASDAQGQNASRSLESDLAAAGLIEGPKSGFSASPRRASGFGAAPALGSSPQPLAIEQDPTKV